LAFFRLLVAFFVFLAFLLSSLPFPFSPFRTFLIVRSPAIIPDQRLRRFELLGPLQLFSHFGLFGFLGCHLVSPHLFFYFCDFATLPLKPLAKAISG
jgi:hypothetical protein